MFGLFRKRQRSIVGADIDSLSASLLELSPEGSTFKLKAYGIGSLAQKEVSGDEQAAQEGLDFEAQGNSLAKLLKAGKFFSRNVISAVPASSVITKHLVMDASLNNEEMESQVVLEAEQVIPYPIEEVAMDFEVLGEHAQDEGKVNVLLVACRKQTVDDRESVLTLAGLSPQAIDVVSYAMERAYSLVQPQLTLPEKGASVALVHVGDLFTTLNILRNNRSVYVRSSPFGLRQMADQLSQKMQCSLQEALNKCLKPDSLGSDAKLVADFYSQAANQVNRLMEQYYSAEHAPIVDHIILSGRFADISVLQQKVEELASVKCTLANPFADMRIASSVNKDQLDQYAPALFVACGLAMRGNHEY